MARTSGRRARRTLVAAVAAALTTLGLLRSPGRRGHSHRGERAGREGRRGPGSRRLLRPGPSRGRPSGAGCWTDRCCAGPSSSWDRSRPPWPWRPSSPCWSAADGPTAPRSTPRPWRPPPGRRSPPWCWDRWPTPSPAAAAPALPGGWAGAPTPPGLGGRGRAARPGRDAGRPAGRRPARSPAADTGRAGPRGGRRSRRPGRRRPRQERGRTAPRRRSPGFRRALTTLLMCAGRPLPRTRRARGRPARWEPQPWGR